MANQEISTVLEQTALRLGAVLYDPAAASTPTRAAPQRYLFIVDPPDLRFWKPGDDISLVCLTDNKASTFWSFVAEKQGDEAFINRTQSWIRAQHLAEAFNGLTIGTLPGNGDLILQYAAIPANFDIALVDAYGIPDHASAVSMHSKLRLKSVQDAIKLREKITDDLLSTYHTIRTWMEASGLFSKDIGPVNATVLIDMILGMDETANGLADFLRLYAVHDNVTAAIRSYPSRFHRADLKYVSIEIQRIANATSALDVSPASQAMAFRQEYCQFVQIRCQAWSNKSHTRTWSRIVSLLPSLRPQLSQIGDLDTRVWPDLFAEDRPTEDEQSLILLIGVKSRSKTALDKLSEALQSFGYDRITQLEGEDFRITIDLVSQEAVSNYRPLPLEDCRTSSVETPLKVVPATLLPDPQVNDAKTKFRTAGQTLSRLRWDPRHKTERYEVGYLDRFDGLIWMSLESWGKPVEDEDFIPEHRIQQFRRSDDQLIIWNRAERIDLTGEIKQ